MSAYGACWQQKDVCKTTISYDLIWTAENTDGKGNGPDICYSAAYMSDCIAMANYRSVDVRLTIVGDKL